MKKVETPPKKKGPFFCVGGGVSNFFHNLTFILSQEPQKNFGDTFGVAGAGKFFEGLAGHPHAEISAKLAFRNFGFSA